jgi:hypothetical protein
VRKYAFGGCAGNPLHKMSLTRNRPPTYGVSTGPSINACISQRSCSFGIKRTPPSSSLSFVISDISFNILLMTCGGIFSVFYSSK